MISQIKIDGRWRWIYTAPNGESIGFLSLWDAIDSLHAVGMMP